MCRSRRVLSNKYLLAKFGFDTAENEPCKVCPLSAYRSPRLKCNAPKTQVADVSRFFGQLHQINQLQIPITTESKRHRGNLRKPIDVAAYEPDLQPLVRDAFRSSFFAAPSANRNISIPLLFLARGLCHGWPMRSRAGHKQVAG